MQTPALHIYLPLLILLLAGCGASNDTEVAVATDPDQTVKTDAIPLGKLPGGVRPKAYRLNLILDPREDRFSGSVDIDIQLDKPAGKIWLHGHGLQVSTITATLPDGEKVLAEYEEVHDSGVAQVSFAYELPAGTFTLQLQYNADFNRNLAGLFKVEEQGDAYALAKSESIQARKYLPGFDEPGLKATFDLILTIPAGYVAITNTPEVGRQAAGPGMERVSFAPTLPMPTYLLSLAVGPFDIVERAPLPANEFRSDSIPLRGIARKDRGGDMNLVLDITPGMVEIFERELRRPYPFKKLDIVAAPQWPSGATELSAAITYREERILVGDDPAPGARLALLDVHAHELAHMWFGNLVTPPWWDDLWLKEGFATWSTPLVLTIFEPEGGHDLNAAVESISAMRLDSLATTRSIRQPITENSDIRNAYDAIAYSKSLGVIHMVDQYFGPEKFRPALGRYVEAFAEGVADSPAFYRVIGEETNTPELTETFRSFVEQKGVPQLDVALACTDESPPVARIRQSRYRPLGSPIPEADEKWNIPVCVRTADEPAQCFMLTEREQELALNSRHCPQWILPNAGGNGYYRWIIAAEQWQALMDHFSQLSGVESLSVIDSAFAAFEAGTLSEDLLLELIALSAKAGQRQVIIAPLTFLRKYHRNYLASSGSESFLEFVRATYLPVLQRTAGSQDKDDQLIYSELLSFMALTAKDPDFRKQLLQQARAFTGIDGERDTEALTSDQYVAALTVAVQDGGEEFLKNLIEVRMEIDDPLFESSSASAIGQINRVESLEQVRQLAVSGQLGSREVFGLVDGLLAEPAFRDQNWKWLRDNFAEVVEKLPEQWRRYTPDFGRTFCDAEKRVELQHLFKENGELVAGYPQILAQTDEQIQLCIGLRERGQAFSKALSRR